MCKQDLFLFDLPWVYYTVPLYDGRKRRLEVPGELGNIPDILPRYVGNIPEYSLALMAYTVSTYSAPSGLRVNLNIHFGVVLHEPLLESVSHVDEEDSLSG